jgi:hypothetical protein
VAYLQSNGKIFEKYDVEQVTSFVYFGLMVQWYCLGC